MGSSIEIYNRQVFFFCYETSFNASRYVKSQRSRLLLVSRKYHVKYNFATVGRVEQYAYYHIPKSANTAAGRVEQYAYYHIPKSANTAAGRV